MVGVTDGLRLHVRDWRPVDAHGAAVVCLPGFARTLEDFGELAEHLSSEPGGERRVVAISARGRGLSDRDPDPTRYQVSVEAADALSALDALSIAEALMVGTSRGGLQAMTIAALRPGALKAVVLNDIGPMIDPLGLVRIRAMLQDRGPPRDWEDAAGRLSRFHGERFPALDLADFDRWARRVWREGPRGLEPAYDPALADAFAAIDLEKPPPPLWPLFDALKAIPLMVIRGEHSDILSAATLAELSARRPDAAVRIVPGQGHAPLLADHPTLDAIAAFLRSADASPR
jgi:pimeloyl-ACP methyl ester carboxylesterase